MGVDAQELIGESFLSPNSHLIGDPMKTGEAVKTGETEDPWPRSVIRKEVQIGMRNLLIPRKGY